jgi:hypothetical protein
MTSDPRTREAAVRPASDGIPGDTPVRLRSGQALPLRERPTPINREQVSKQSIHYKFLVMSGEQASPGV